MKSREYNKRKVFGVGINDSKTAVKIKEKRATDGRWVDVWVCPAYRTWVNMLSRCYGARGDAPSYEDKHVCPEWLSFSSFRGWYLERSVEGWQLDKDVLTIGNKVYSPDSCVFIPQYLNSALSHNKITDNGLPLGVHLSTREGTYTASCGRGRNMRYSYGHHCPQAAHRSWIMMKIDNLLDHLSMYEREECASGEVISAILMRVGILRNRLESGGEIFKGEI